MMPTRLKYDSDFAHPTTLTAVVKWTMTMNSADRPTTALARNVRRLGHLDLAGAGQVTVAGSHAYVGHLPNREQLGTTILDISEPARPRVVATVMLDDPRSHSHKV